MIPPTAILLAAVGSRHPHAREAYGRILEEFRRRHPQAPVSCVFTSEESALPEALEALGRNTGIRRVVVQSLHVVPGQEFEKLEGVAAPAGIELRLGRPLLDTAADIEAVAAALRPEFLADGINVLAGHGNRRPGGNAALVALAEACRQHQDNVRLCTLNGEPGLAPLEEIRTLATGAWLRFIPLMLVAGAHIRHDVMGDGPESWKSRIGIATATCAAPLGENPRILEIFDRHLREALAGTSL